MRALLAGLVVAAGLAGCAAAPTEVPGRAGPLAATATASPSRAPVATRPSGSPTPPARYAPYALRRHGVTATLPVPVDWSLTETARGVDLGDPTGNVLLRVDIVAAGGPTARGVWEAAESGFRSTLPGYRRLGLADVPGLGDDAADLTFTFDRDGVTRRVIDRGILVRGAHVAIYYSAPQSAYDRMAPVFDRASRDLVLS